MIRQDEFNPFGKTLFDVRVADLEKLSTVAEGQFVEYKSDVPSASKVAKSIASFANSHGGLYLLGVVSDKQTNCATQFTGVEMMVDYIHDAVVGNLSPFPEFHVHSVPLVNQRYVVIVSVSEGQDAPYIHNDGRIYRRQQSSSDPVVETNRFVVDELYDRKAGLQRKMENFRGIPYGFAKGESQLPFLAVYINPYPFNAFNLNGFITSDKLSTISAIFNSTFTIEEEGDDGNRMSIGGNIVLSNAMSLSDSVFLTELAGRDLAYHGMSVEITSHGNLRSLIPLASFTSQSEIDPELITLLRQRRTEVSQTTKFVPMGAITKPVMTVVTKYLSLLQVEHYQGFIQFAFQTLNCYRSVLYSRTQTYRDFVEKFGLPLSVVDSQAFPEIPNSIKVNEFSVRPVLSIIYIASYILQAFGIPNPDSTNILVEDIKSTTVSN